jgi:hypothetical protein
MIVILVSHALQESALRTSLTLASPASVAQHHFNARTASASRVPLERAGLMKSARTLSFAGQTTAFPTISASAIITRTALAKRPARAVFAFRMISLLAASMTTARPH